MAIVNLPSENFNVWIHPSLKGILPTCKPKEKGFLFAVAKERFSNNRYNYWANPDVKINDTASTFVRH
jgi:hypothetical protein